MKLRDSLILDAKGEPFRVNGTGRVNGHDPEKERQRPGLNTKSVLQVGGEYGRALSFSRMAPSVRAQDPFTSNVWVFASAMRTALASSQAEYKAFEETEAELRMRAKTLGRERAQPRAGRKRRAVQRWVNRSCLSRAMRTKAIEPLLTHPVMDLLHRPNPYQAGNELMLVTILWLAVRGEAVWIKTDSDGMPSGLGMPDMLWPVPPDCLRPDEKSAFGGEITGWILQQPRWMTGFRAGFTLRLEPDDIVQFKLPNPTDITRGLSPYTAASSTIELDLMMRNALRNLIENGSMPPNVLYHPEDLDEDQRREIGESFAELGKEKRTAVLAGGLKLASVAHNPQQMGFFEQPKTARDEVLASGGTAESALGLSEFTNYATAVANDYSFWEKGIVPLLRIVETVMDYSLFGPETDRVFGMFDLTQVEALRAGLLDKMAIARGFCGSELHMPPDVAYQVVGLDSVPRYEADDKALVGIGIGSVEDALAADPEPELEPTTEPEVEEPEAEDPDADEEEAEADQIGVTAIRTAKGRKARNSRRNREYLALQTPIENEMRRLYRRWINGERKLVLAAFDQIGSKARTKNQVDLEVVLPVGEEAQERLRKTTRKLQVDSLLKIFEFTESEIGIPIFAIDDQVFVDFFRAHEKNFTSEASDAVRRNLARTLEEGLREGESISELRSRIGQVFDLSASSHRTLMTARTTTSSFMSGARDQMFHLQGIESGEWSTNGDEHVRPAHVLFGESGTQELGFNFLELTGESGRLEHPGDIRAPFGQIASCRCLWIPTA